MSTGLSKNAMALGFTICIFINDTYAQYSFSPSTTLIVNQDLNTMIYDSIHILNISSDTVELKWKLISYDTLNGTYFDFCSSGTCWIGMPDSGSFAPIEPGGFGFAGMHFWTGNVPHTSSTKIWVYENGSPAVGDTLTYILTGQPLGTEEYYGNNNLFSIGPNPARDFLNITSKNVQAECISFYNSKGQLLHSYPGATIIDLSPYPNDCYFVIISFKAGISSKRILINR